MVRMILWENDNEVKYS